MLCLRLTAWNPLSEHLRVRTARQHLTCPSKRADEMPKMRGASLGANTTCSAPEEALYRVIDSSTPPPLTHSWKTHQTPLPAAWCLRIQIVPPRGRAGAGGHAVHTPTSERANDLFLLPRRLPLSRRLLPRNNGVLPPSLQRGAGLRRRRRRCVCLQGATVITPRASGESAPAAAAAC